MTLKVAFDLMHAIATYPLSSYTRKHTHTHMHIHIHTCTHIYTRTCAHTHMHTYMYARTHVKQHGQALRNDD